MRLLSRLLCGTSVIFVYLIAGEFQPQRTSAGAYSWLVELAFLALTAAAFTLWLALREPCFPVIGAGAALCVIALLTLHLWFGPAYFRSDAIRAKVVDQQTDVPIANAVVRAEWRLRKLHTLEEDRPAGVLHSETTRTGPDGSFALHAWGPSFRPPLTWLASQDPTITVVTPSGVVTVVNNSSSGVLWADGKVPNASSSKRWTTWSPQTPIEASTRMH